ncbi:MAG: flagellar biosynthetic protein FliO [Gemmataceae bacterium]|nr:flagellar biosynthetic protein FliO [Gemmata sp.]MDW8199015.1 flagellar biosynthetic protein FliO [Gemmataceae bacterium]
MAHPRSTPSPRKLLPAWIAAGLVVVAVGFALPMLAAGTRWSPASSRPRSPVADSARTVPPDAPATRDSSRPVPPDAPTAPGIGASLVKLGLGLVVVGGLCVLVARWLQAKTARGSASTPLETIASVAVGPGVIHLVQAGPRRLLIGTDGHGVKTLLELPGPGPEPPALPPTAAAATRAARVASASVSPAEILQLVVRRSEPPRPTPDHDGGERPMLGERSPSTSNVGTVAPGAREV